MCSKTNKFPNRISNVLVIASHERGRGHDETQAPIREVERPNGETAGENSRESVFVHKMDPPPVGWSEPRSAHKLLWLGKRISVAEVQW